MERFWSKVDVTPGCWNWTAARYPNGYGIFNFDGEPTGAHRVSYRLSHGDIPAGLCVLHRCDNRRCVNPDHLFIGTKKENTRDMLAKGRFRYVPMRVRRGPENHASKLSELSVQRIRIVGNALPQDEIGRMVGLSQTAVGKIQRRKLWAHLGTNRASV